MLFSDDISLIDELEFEIVARVSGLSWLLCNGNKPRLHHYATGCNLLDIKSVT